MALLEVESERKPPDKAYNIDHRATFHDFFYAHRSHPGPIIGLSYSERRKRRSRIHPRSRCTTAQHRAGRRLEFGF
jgi:hypothetical protein